MFNKAVNKITFNIFESAEGPWTQWSWIQGLAEINSASLEKLEHSHTGPVVKDSQGEILTFVILTRDNISTIERCIRSLGPDVPVLLYDTGSTDGTVAKAISISENVNAIGADWEGDFSQARNAALDHVDKGWVCFLDADEFIAPGDAETLSHVATVLNAHSQKKWICGAVLLSDKDRGETSKLRRMLLADGKLRYKGSLHEELTCDDPELLLEVSLRSRMFHDGYSREIEARQARNRSILDSLTESSAQGEHYLRHWAAEMIEPSQVEDRLSLLHKLVDKNPTASNVYELVIAETVVNGTSAACTIFEMLDERIRPELDVESRLRLDALYAMCVGTDAVARIERARARLSRDLYRSSMQPGVRLYEEEAAEILAELSAMIGKYRLANETSVAFGLGKHFEDRA